MTFDRYSARATRLASHFARSIRRPPVAAVVLTLALIVVPGLATAQDNSGVALLGLYQNIKGHSFIQDGDRLYVVDNTNLFAPRLKRLNTDNPEEVRVAAQCQIPIEPNQFEPRFAIHDSLLVVSDRRFGLRLFDISDFDNPSLRFTIPVLGAYSYGSVNLEGNLLTVGYVPTSLGLEYGSILIDVSNPSAPQFGSLISVNYPIAIESNHLFSSDGQVFDISDPLHPALVAENSSLGAPFVHGLSVRDSLLFVMKEDQFSIYRVSDSYRFSQLAIFTEPNNADFRAGYPYRGLLFTASPWGLVTYDLAQPMPQQFIRKSWRTPRRCAGCRRPRPDCLRPGREWPHGLL